MLSTELIEQVKRDEGFRGHVYKDSEGHLTIGYGTNLDAGISKFEAETMLIARLDAAEKFVCKHFPWVEKLNDARQGVLINMAYNLGEALLEFKCTLACIEAGNYEEAAEDMLLSKWALQVGDRAKRLSKQMLEGEWE